MFTSRTFALTCFVFAFFGHRTALRKDQLQSNVRQERARSHQLFESDLYRASTQADRPNLKKALAMLLIALDPSSAFNVLGPPAQSGLVGSPRVLLGYGSSPQGQQQSPLRKPSMMAGGKKKSKKKTVGKKPTSGTGFGAKPTQKPASLGGFARDTFKYTGDLRPGKQTPMRSVPAEIPLPDYAVDGRPKARGPLFQIQEKKTAEDIEGMRVAGLVARNVLDAAGRAVAVGTTTEEIDEIVHAETIARGAYPSPLNYHRFPKSCCTSVNEVICHGIPDSYKLRDGDIINIDITVYYGGYHGDCSEMFLVGNVDDRGKQLVKVTHDAWQAAIDYCKPGRPYKGIGPIIEDYVKQYGYSTAKEFCGHGIGKVFHTDPNIIHARNNVSGTMELGHTFTIEPMICEGTSQHLLWNDQWTATTKDGKRSAQFEHTLLVTEDGVDALTARLPNSNSFWWEDDVAA